MERATPRFQRICLARSGLPGDRIAWERAVHLCQAMGASLDIVAVRESPATSWWEALASIGADPVEVLGERELNAELETMVAETRAAGIVASRETLSGSAPTAIVEFTRRRRNDLLVKTAQPTSFTRQILIGHVDRQLVRKCDCPVWIEKAAEGFERGRILATVDPTPSGEACDADPVRESLNASILEVSLAVARALGAELHVAHVWPFPMEDVLRSRAGLSDELIAQAGVAIQMTHSDALARLVTPYMRDIVKVHLVKGDSGVEIARVAEVERMDLIVMGTVCRAGLSGFLIGNTAETVLEQAPCGVLALKPPLEN